MSIAELNNLFIPPTPEQVIFCLEQGTSGTLRGKAFVLVVDGLRMLNQGILNRSPRRDIVTRLGNLAHVPFASLGLSIGSHGKYTPQRCDAFKASDTAPPDMVDVPHTMKKPS